MGSLYLVRHGQASFGAADYDALSAIGEQQASTLGRALRERGYRFDRVLMGSMKRHTETARLCLQEMPSAPSPETASWLNEFDHQAILTALHPDFADAEKVKAFLKKQPEPAKAFHKEFEKAMQRWMEGAHDVDYPESFRGFQKRCHEGVKALVNGAASEESILLFTSGGPIACLLQKTLELSDTMMLRLNGAIVNSSVTRLSFKGDLLFLSCFNDHAHCGSASSPLLTYR